MKRALVTVAALVVAVSTSCVDTSSGSGDQGQGSKDVRISVQVSGGESEIAAIEEMAESFEATRAGVTVEVIGVPSPGDHMARLATSFAAGRPPDVFLLNYRRFGQFAAKGVITPAVLGDLQEAEFFAPPIEAFTFDGRLLCLPQNISSSVTYFNPKLFAKHGVPLPRPGWTLADMGSAAERLSAGGVEAIGFEHSFRTLPPFVWTNGGDVVDDLHRPTAITLRSPPARQALTYLRDLLRFGVDAGDAAADPAEERFARGELAMFLDSRRAVPKFRKSEGLVFDVAPLPVGTTPATLLASDAYCVAKATEHREAAHAFVRHAVGPEGGRVLAEAGRTVPSHKALAESGAFLAPQRLPASSQVWLDVVPHLRRLPRVAQRNEAEEGASDVLEQFFAGRLSIDEAVERIERDSRAALAKGR